MGFIQGLQQRSLPLEKLYPHYGLDPDKIPVHVAIIMDGNGRWAKQRFFPRSIGHNQGAEAVRRTIKACIELGIRYLSLYTFSTENWNRPKEEVSFLMNLFKRLLKKELNELHRNKVRLRIVGDMEGVDPEIQSLMHTCHTTTDANRVLQVNVLFNYGGRREIVHACKKMALELKEGLIQDITEDNFPSYLYLADSPDPDIFIRTGGNNIRISNFLLWQLSYTELFFLETLWPDFSKDLLIDVIRDFQKRDRKFGGLTA